MALVISVGLITYVNAVQEDRQLSVPAEAWFTVNSIYVPDHVEGSNPIMIYDRTIIEPHRGFWIAEAQRQAEPGVAKFFNECSGSGVADYDLEDVIPANEVEWSWFFGRKCEVPPGTYRIQMTKDMVRPDWPVKSMKPVYSNVFRVLPRGGS